ncbi:UNVERIFIED_ORG: 8-oxo-dGTP pyrophosphatase MutT (NUDIX family) [Martelella mediterranea]
MKQDNTVKSVIAAYDARFSTRYSAFVRDAVDYASRHTFPVHATASLFAFSPDATRIALIHHRATGKWFQPGGHLDPGETPAEAACRECREETGLIAELAPDEMPVSLDLHRIPENSRKGEPEHYHLDIRFAAIVSGTLTPNLLEVHDARWFDAEHSDTVDERVRARFLPGAK